MRFVPHDEESNSWSLEEEPTQLEKDIWGRKQIEVRRDLPTPHLEEVRHVQDDLLLVFLVFSISAC